MSYWYYQYLQVEQAHTQNSDGEFKKTSILIFMLYNIYVI